MIRSFSITPLLMSRLMTRTMYARDVIQVKYWTVYLI